MFFHVTLDWLNLTTFLVPVLGLVQVYPSSDVRSCLVTLTCAEPLDKVPCFYHQEMSQEGHFDSGSDPVNVACDAGLLIFVALRCDPAVDRIAPIVRLSTAL